MYLLQDKHASILPIILCHFLHIYLQDVQESGQITCKIARSVQVVQDCIYTKQHFLQELEVQVLARSPKFILHWFGPIYSNTCTC